MTRADKRIEWKVRFDSWKDSGLSVAEWCRGEGIKTSQMYYWIRIFEENVSSEQETETQWLTVNVNDEPKVQTGEDPVFVHVDAISVEVRSGVNMELLSNVLQVLQGQ